MVAATVLFGGVLSAAYADGPAPDAAHAAAHMVPVQNVVTPPPRPIFDPRLYGAKGDGVTYDTAAIQKAIDKCGGTGGSVVLKGGTFLSAQLTLRGRMTFFIAPEATLLGGIRPEDYPQYVPPGAFNKDIRHSLLLAVGADDFTLDGGGTIDGQGQKMTITGREPFRPAILRVFQSANVTVRGLTVRNPRMWTMFYEECPHLTIQGLTIRSPAGYCPNLDGMDICDSRDVLIRDNDIAAQDDGICLKTTGPVGLHRVRIENNWITDFEANAIKIGTATFGPIEDILIQNNTVRHAKLGGVCIESVDGSHLRNVRVQDDDIYDVAEPFYIRLARRGGGPTPAQGSLEDVTIDHVRVLATRSESGTGSTITGTNLARVRNVSVKDCYLELPGGRSAPATIRKVDDAGYPQSSIFGVTPGYAFFVFHADGVHFENVTCGFARSDTRDWLASVDSTVTDHGCTDRRQVPPTPLPRDAASTGPLR